MEEYQLRVIEERKELDKKIKKLLVSFLTAFFATQVGREVVLTGSSRMQERPIGVLVEALRKLGAQIAYEQEEGYPPLRITGKALKGGAVSLPANISSQYISALMLVAVSVSVNVSVNAPASTAKA